MRSVRTGGQAASGTQTDRVILEPKSWCDLYIGTEERQLVAGIRAHYTPEELIGKQIVVVANLQPAVLRGVESQGMLLAASDGEKVIVLSPEKPIAAGAKVR